MSTSTQLAQNAYMLPHLFSATRVKLDQVRVEHKNLLISDRMMRNKLEHISSAFKQLSMSELPIPDAMATLLITQITKTSQYARDMAEQEQRIVAESHQRAAGNEESEAGEYFVISDQLDHCASDLRWNLTHKDQPKPV